MPRNACAPSTERCILAQDEPCTLSYSRNALLQWSLRAARPSGHRPLVAQTSCIGHHSRVAQVPHAARAAIAVTMSIQPPSGAPATQRHARKSGKNEGGRGFAPKPLSPGAVANGTYAPSQRLSTRLALVPPKPKLLDRTWRSGASRVTVTSGMPSTAGSGVSTLAEPAMKPLLSISRQ